MSSPSSLQLVTCTTLVLFAFGILCAHADQIVFQNTSYIFGFATMLEDGRVVNVGDSFNT